MTNGIISFPTFTARAIWIGEILGQLSDGAWENTHPLDHWRFWHSLDCVVGPETKVVACVPSNQKKNYDLNRLIDVVGRRMIQQAKGALVMGEIDHETINMFEYFPETFDLYKQLFEDNFSVNGSKNWKYAYLFLKRFDKLHFEIAEAYYSTSYNDSDLKKDLALIKRAMKNAT